MGAIMKNFKNLFSKNEKSVNKIETVYGDVDASIDIVSQYLHDIEEDLLKLEIISRLSDDTYLESKILYYKEKLQSLKNEYELENSNSKEVLSIYGKDINYKLQLSLLLDETHLLSKKYFYLNSFNSFLEQSVDEVNFDIKKKELLESEVEIQGYLNGNDQVDKKLKDKFIDVIWNFLKQEVKLSKNLDFYMKVSRKTQLLIEEKFLAELLKRVENDSYIEEYIKKSDMEQLTFDYDIFSYIALGKKKNVIKETETNENQLVVPTGIENLKLNFDFLRKKQLTGLGKLSIFKKKGIQAVATDFTIARGNKVYPYIPDDDSNDLQNLGKRFGTYWSRTLSFDFPSIYVVTGQGYIDTYLQSNLCTGCRLVLRFSTIEKFCSNKHIDADGVLTVEFGEYPQTAGSKCVQDMLFLRRYQKNLQETGKSFSIAHSYNNIDLKNMKKGSSFTEYYLDGKKYILLNVSGYSNPLDSKGETTSVYLSNGMKYKNGAAVWIEVQPIRWWVDEKKDLAVSEKILLNEQFDFSSKKVFLEDSSICSFINNSFAKDIIPSKIDSENGEAILLLESDKSDSSYLEKMKIKTY